MKIYKVFAEYLIKWGYHCQKIVEEEENSSSNNNSEDSPNHTFTDSNMNSILTDRNSKHSPGLNLCKNTNSNQESLSNFYFGNSNHNIIEPDSIDLSNIFPLNIPTDRLDKEENENSDSDIRTNSSSESSSEKSNTKEKKENAIQKKEEISIEKKSNKIVSKRHPNKRFSANPGPTTSCIYIDI